MYSFNSLTRQFDRLKYNARKFNVSSKLKTTKRHDIHKGKVAVCVGCTQDMGYEMAKRLAEEGANVVVGSRRQEKVDMAVDRLKSYGLKASGVACHVGNIDQRRELLKKAAEIKGSFDILVNHAGVNAFVGPMLETPATAFEKAFDVNVSSCFYLIQEAVSHMTNRMPGTSIVVTSSAAAHFPHHYAGAYVVSKGSIPILARALMPELLERNIRINCVNYGVFKTPFAGAILNDEKISRLMLDHLTPMKRCGEPEECAGLVSFPCSEDASFITGGLFAVNGGMTY